MTVRLGAADFRVSRNWDVRSSRTVDFSAVRIGLNNEPYTMEFWFYSDNPSNGIFLSQNGGVNSWTNTNGLLFDLYYDGGAEKVVFGRATSSSVFVILSDGSLSASQWHHIAVSYDGTTTRMFIDGIKQVDESTAVYGDRAGANTLEIGAQINAIPLAGYIDELRIVSGQAIWTDDFTPPGSAYNY